MGPSDTRFCEEWKRCLPYLKPAIERTYGAYLQRDILDGILKLDYHLWPFKQSAAITEFHAYPRLMACNVFLAGGELGELIEWQRPGGVLEQWARFQGCVRVQWTGRRGWVKEADGREIYATMMRDFSNGQE